MPRAALDTAREIAPRPVSNTPRFQRRDGAPDPCEGMNDSERALFNHLREWRSTQAREEGVPPYLLLTNRQLVAVIRKRPESLTALGHLDGIGPGKVERYGAAILRALHGGSAGSAASADPAPEAAPKLTDAAEIEVVELAAAEVVA